MFWKKPKQTFTLPASGILIKPELTTKKTSNLYICLLRGLIIFLAGIGTAGCYMTAFSIKFHVLPVLLTMLGASFVLSFFYYNRIVLNVGYVVFFILYAPLLFQFKTYLQSGWNAILNQTIDVVDEFFILPARHQYVEQISDRTFSVTVFLCFVGIFYCLILNAIISGYMSIVVTFLASFPLIALGMFFEKRPDSFWFTCVILAWTMVYILKKSKLYKNQKKRNRSYRYIKNSHTFSYSNEAKGLFQTCLFITGSAAALFVLLLYVYPVNVFQTPQKWNRYKKAMEEPVRNFAILGFSSFFNQYEAAGGVGGGKLGGIGSVRPDFETDLQVEFTPYSNKTVYLPAFYANEYIPYENKWDLVYNHQNQHDNASAFNKEASLLKKHSDNDSSIFHGKMRITVTGAKGKYVYHPYFSLFDQNVTSGLNLRYYDNYYIRTLHNQTSTEFTYYQSSEATSYSDATPGFLGLHEFHVPSDLEETLQKICKEQGFGGTQEQIVSQIQTYLEKNFTYSLKPGLTPKKADFVTYFLTKRKKGYCVYFASAATLLLREMGVPARYVEGYAFDYDKVLDSDEVNGEDYDDWFSGTSELGRTTVVKVDVSDADAHAWTEYYKEGFGWVPLEVTTAQSEPDSSSNAFWDFFSSAFTNNAGNADTSQSFTALNKGIANHSRQASLYVVLIVVVLIAGRLFVRKWSWYIRLHHSDLQLRVVGSYQYITKLLSLRHGKELENKEHSYITNWLDKEYPTDAIDYSQWIALVKRAAYSNHTLSTEEFQTSNFIFLKLKRMIWKQLSLRSKAKAFFLKAPRKMKG